MRKSNITCILFFIILLISMQMVIFFTPQNTVYANEYIFLGINMIIFLGINFVFFYKFSIYVFEPIFLIFILYLFVFFIAPMLNIVTNTTDCMGYSVMEGCVKATLIFMVTYLMLLLGYYGSFNKKSNFLYKKNPIVVAKQPRNKHIEKIAFVLWIISFSFGCIELVSKGMNINYFLTLGLTGNIENLYADSAFGFLGNFRFSMISSWLYLFVCNKKSIKTKICGFLTLEYFILRGFRHSLFVLIFAPIVYSFIKENKKPKLRSIIIMFILVVFVMGIMQFVRSALREGTSIDWSTFDFNIFIEAIQGNCDIYKTFYGMVVAVPEKLNYQFGMASIVSVITMIIPRSIWPGKPTSPIITNLDMFCGELAAKSGYAMPNISEYYLDFGLFGCMIIMFIFGLILKKLKNLYRFKYYDTHGLILYSIFFPALLQVILRGYSPSYVFLLFFYAFPVIIIKLFVREEKPDEKKNNCCSSREATFL